MDKLQTLQQELVSLQDELRWAKKDNLPQVCLKRMQEAIDRKQAQIAALKEEGVLI